MTFRLSQRVLSLLCVLGVLSHAQGQDDFASQVQLEPLSQIAVHSGSRLKSLGSHANGVMSGIAGPRSIGGQSPLYTMIDLLFRPEAYHDADLIYIKNKAVRNQIIDVLEKTPAIAAVTPDLAERMAAFRKTGLLAPRLVIDPALRPLLKRLQTDLLRTANQVSAIEQAMFAMRPDIIAQGMKVLAPAGDGSSDSWRSIIEIMALPQENPETQIPELQPQATLPALTDQSQAQLDATWRNLQEAWVAGDAAQVNLEVAAFAQLLAAVNPQVYPESSRLSWESWYFRNKQMTALWLVYMLSVILLLFGLVYRWRWANWSGLVVFVLAFAGQTFAIWLRWHISGRWPNANMYEAVTTAAWFGAASALVIEFFAWKTPMRSIFALAAAVASMVALMSARFLPAFLDPNIDNVMPVLSDIWLYIHTNVIIFSYCLIFMAAVSALLYLVNRLFGGAAAYARVGGAGSIVLGQSSRGESRADRRAGLSETLDGVTMLLMELAFVLLWAGIVMGAIWADHSWGRPWGWDPKEVFALNTFLVFAVLVHVRLKVRDKGLWTAWLALVGAAVMLFNWIVINFVITGLHSYA